MAEGCEAPHESLDILDIPDLVNFVDGQDLVGVCLDAKVHFSGFSLMLKRLRLVKVSYPILR
jgi:hypothetical protein